MVFAMARTGDCGAMRTPKIASSKVKWKGAVQPLPDMGQRRNDGRGIAGNKPSPTGKVAGGIVNRNSKMQPPNPKCDQIANRIKVRMLLRQRGLRGGGQ
jgi:hypothetical protein